MRTHPPQPSNTKKIVLTTLGYTLLVGGLLLGLTVIRVNVVKESYRLQQAKIEKNQLLQKISELEVQYSESLTPSKVEELAKHKFHLSKPNPKQVVYFKSEE